HEHLEARLKKGQVGVLTSENEELTDLANTAFSTATEGLSSVTALISGPLGTIVGVGVSYVFDQMRTDALHAFTNTDIGRKIYQGFEWFSQEHLDTIEKRILISMLASGVQGVAAGAHAGPVGIALG